jgi:hypothetical protein
MSSIKILKVLEVLQARGLLQAPGQLDLLAEEIEKELSLSTKASAKNLGKFKGFTTGER